jgi:hypothetical protein
MKQIKALFIVLLVTVCGCSSRKSIIANQEHISALQLGAIVESSGLISHNLEVKTTPRLKKSVRLGLQPKEFSKSTFKKYERLFEGSNATIKYHDSLQQKPTYLTLEIVDDVVYADMINSQPALLEFIESSNDTRVLTAISFVVPTTVNIDLSHTFFLEADNNNTYRIVYYLENEIKGYFSFNEINVFDYQLSSFCWGLDKRGASKVMDIVEEGKSCDRPLKRSPEKLKKSTNLFDY